MRDREASGAWTTNFVQTRLILANPIWANGPTRARKVVSRRVQPEPGLHTTRELQTPTFKGPGFSKTPPKFNEKTPPKRQKREGGRGKKNERNFGRFGGGGVRRKGLAMGRRGRGSHDRLWPVSNPFLAKIGVVFVLCLCVVGSMGLGGPPPPPPGDT